MKKTLVLLFLLLQVWTASAGSWYFKPIGIEEGLSQSSVTCMAYDGYGALWIGTRFGLNEYRNGRMRTFLDDEEAGAKGNYINLLYCDSFRNLWVSTDKGLFRYDHSEDEFILFHDQPVLCALETDGRLLFGGHEGIVTYDYSSSTITPGDSDVYTDIMDMYEYKGELYFLDRRNGLSRRNGHGTFHVDIPGLDGNLIMASAMDGDALYLSVLNVGLVIVDLSGNSAPRVFSSGKDGLPSEVILSLLVVGRDLWIGTDGGGVAILDLEHSTFSNLEDVNRMHSGVRIPISVTTLFQDPFKNVWIGSVRSGAVGLKPSTIKSYSSLGAGMGALNENVVIWLHGSDDGMIYVGTDGSGVFRFDPASGMISSFAGHAGLKVTSIADFDAARLLIATYNQGFFLMDRTSGRLSRFLLRDEATNAEECFNSNAPTIFNGGDGTLLLLAVNTFSYDKSSGVFTTFTDETIEDGKELCIIGPSNSPVLYAYSSSGLFTVDRSERCVNVLMKSDIELGRINTAVYHAGKVYFGTNYGLYYYDPMTGACEKFATGFFTRVTRLAFSHDGNLWIAADNSLFLYHDGVMEMTGENRGVPANEILSSVEGADGSIYFGGTRGFLEIGRYSSVEEEPGKQLELHDVNVTGNRKKLASGILRVPHNYSSLVLTVNLVGADPFEKNMYRYSVEGENGFTVETYEDNIPLPALKPGSYRVEASYLKADGVWSEPENVLGLRVTPPWYKSILMIVVYVLLVVALIAWIIRIMSKRALARMEAELRAKDLQFATKFENYLDEHLSDNNLNASELATQMAMSRASLYYKVNSAFGKGVAELIEEKRMSKAEELLSTTPLSVLEISEKVGYSTSRYFSTRFKQLHDGMTPLKYRQSRRG